MRKPRLTPDERETLKWLQTPRRQETLWAIATNTDTTRVGIAKALRITATASGSRIGELKQQGLLDSVETNKRARLDLFPGNIATYSLTEKAKRLLEHMVMPETPVAPPDTALEEHQ